jgi:hypothetical protein
LGGGNAAHEFIGLVGSAATWPLVVRAQQPDQMRRVGVLMAYLETDPEAKALLWEFTDGLSELGWADDCNLRLNVRYAPANNGGCRGITASKDSRLQNGPRGARAR